MSVEQKNSVTLVTEESFQAVGLKWEGTFDVAFAGEIRDVQKKMHDRLNEIQFVENPDVLLGLSYHATQNASSFTHYSVVKASQVEDVPSGMVMISVPELTYAKCEHAKGQSIKQSYNNIYDWIKAEGYKENRVGDLTHFEKYQMAQNPYDQDPEFTIMIPITKET
ncbi:GyrI-like domain-containing protein [Pseudalkalibacillus salsuginis]|uniref:GyrI-like domain-containing protein n=1 Tax=Pseudalkalibacillus salsuginis TaxID=2910972 RepID=UPI001F2416BD|nr:effector binding domain-containing protein [Pseudalkalibacillus salsuginis]MCF6410767.1 effector binding domain-containing protein [Pseudalkalibacillus salsuginis]